MPLITLVRLSCQSHTDSGTALIVRLVLVRRRLGGVVE